MKRFIPTIIAMGTGIIVLLSYFFSGGELLSLRLVLIDWAVTLAGLAVLVGILNLLIVNGRRFISTQKGWFYNFITFAVALATIIVGIIDGFGRGPDALYAEGAVLSLLYEGVIASSQAAITILIMFILITAAVRMMKTRPSGWSVVFLLAVVVALVGWIPLAPLGIVNQISSWIAEVPVMAGARGILIGVGLGVLVVGIRVLTGLERPYAD